jgi:hypothetical protein
MLLSIHNHDTIFFEAVDQPLALYWRVVKWCGFVEFQHELRKKMQKSGNLQKIKYRMWSFYHLEISLP